MRTALHEPAESTRSSEPAVQTRNSATSAVLELQRTAGNRATTAALGHASGREVARCAGACTCGGRCHGAQPDEELEVLGRRALTRSVLDRAERLSPPRAPR